MRPFGPVICLSLLMTLLPADANAIEGCSYQPSKVAGFANGDGTGRLIETNGVNGFVGEAFISSNPYPRGAVWQDGTIVTDFGALGMAAGVNRSGDAVGWSWGGTASVYLPSGGKAVRLAIPPQVTRSIPVATGISDDGLIIGYARFDDGTNHALTWHTSTASVMYRDLGATGVYVSLKEVSDNGRVVGITKRGQHFTAVSGTSLTPLPGVDPSVDSEASDIAGRFVLGRGAVPGQGSGTVLWENDVPRLIGTTGTATDVNGNGLVVGNDASGPFVQQGDARIVLPALPGHVSAHAAAITDDGRVAGWSKAADSGAVPVIWTCS